MRISDWSSDVCSSDLVNQLKYINDSFGHAAGDFALMEIAKRLAASIRATDVAARIGGDEFGLILDQSSEDGESAQVDRLCEIGRASWRGRVCVYVLIWVGALSLKKKKKKKLKK